MMSRRSSRSIRGLCMVAPYLVALCMVALCMVALASCSSTPAPPPPATGPSTSVVPLDGWKVTLPSVGKKGNAAVVDPAQLSPPWLTTDAGGNLVFWAPANGATTEHSEHPRTELDNLANFQAGSGPQALTASVSVAQVPAAGQDVIIGQIHGADDISSVPFVMLHYAAGAISVVVKQHQSGDAHLDYPLLADVPLAARFDYGIRDNGDGNLTFTATYNGENAAMNAPLPVDFRDATVRFQAGAYQQASTDSGVPAAADDGARLTFFSLRTDTGAGAPPP
jgi:Alginate lyase